MSVIVATLDEAGELPDLLEHLAGLAGDWEVIVADGGSRDATLRLAEEHARVDATARVPGGRARQLNAGASLARGEILVFLHADSRLPPGAHACLRATGARGGNFAVRFEGADRFSRLLTRVYALQRRAGVYYGDSTLWARRELFAALGGFRELAIMDDYDFVRRLERATSTACLPGPATTSARRWRTQGVGRTVLSWVVIRWLFVLGMPPERLARLYRRIR